jgi:hypothetical protein
MFSARRRTWIGRAALAATAASIGLVASGAVLFPAAADAPLKVGWWNLASGGGQAAPAPDVPEGGLRVAVGSSQWLAYGAVQYALPKDGNATLDLPVAQITTGSGAPQVNNVLACPTKDANWKGGGDQDASGAPAFDCSTYHFVGRLSSDQKSMSFQIDGSADVSDGVLSLAIVPDHTAGVPYVGTDTGTGADMTPPFAVDFDKVGANSFTSDQSSSASQDSGSSGGSSAGSTGVGATAGGASGGTSMPAAAPPATGDVSVPPASADLGAGQAPVVAGQQPAAPAVNGAAPAAAVGPLKPDGTKRDLLLVMLILLLFAILYTQNATQRAPRRLGGGAGRGADPAGPAAGEAVAVQAAPPIGPYPMGPYPMGVGTPRGLGRFAKPRTGAARPLI